MKTILQTKSVLLTTVIIVCSVVYVSAQSVSINNDGSTAHASAIPDVKSSNKGMLMPRLSRDNRRAIENPATGLVVYQTDDTTGYWFYNGIRWMLMQDNMGNHTLSQNLRLNSNFLSYKGDSLGMKMGDSGRLSIYTKLSCCVDGIQERFRFDNDGGLLLRGELGIGKIPMEGKGLRFMWHPYKGSFRAGIAENNEWNESEIGFYLWAGGSSTKASGLYSFCYGEYSKATATSSVAFGSSNNVYGAAGFSTGYSNQVDQTYGVVFGTKSVSRGYGAIAMGSYLVSKGYFGTTVGMFNDSLLTATETVPSAATPLFVVGNGSSNTVRSNAMVVRKNGDVEVENLQIGGGTTVSKQQSGTFFAGPNPTGGTKTISFSFPTGFSSVPKITATPRNQPGTDYPDSFILTVRSISATSVTFNIIRVDAAVAWAQNLYIDYTAWE